MYTHTHTHTHPLADTHFPHPLAHTFTDVSRDTHHRHTQRTFPQAHADPDRLGHTNLHTSRDTETTQSQHINICICTQTHVHQSSSIHSQMLCTDVCTCRDTCTLINTEMHMCRYRHTKLCTHIHTQTCVNMAHTYMFTVNTHTDSRVHTHTHIHIHGGTYTYSQTHKYTHIHRCMYRCNRQVHTCTHINSEIHGKTGCRQILNTHMCAHRHPDTQTPAHTQTRMCANILGHACITDTRDALWRGVEAPVRTQTAPCAPAHALAGACPLLPARSRAPGPGRTPAPTHSSLRGPWPEAGQGPGSGGWARGGGGWRQHQAGERKRPGDLGCLRRLGPAQGCPGPHPGMRN